MKKLYLVDSSSLFFRAFYAIRPLSSPDGLPVNAIYGYLSMILKLIKSEKPDLLAFCHDTKEPSFRKNLYDDYKANRTEMPDDLQKQMPFIKEVSKLLGIAAFEKIGFEADDLIGSLTEWGLKQGYQVYIVSGDKDFAQLVKPNVFLYDTMKDERSSEAEVLKKYEVLPKQFIDYLAIVGDTSDNVPGVKGIGPKGAVKLLNEFGSLESIYESIDKIEGKNKEKLIQSKDHAFLSKKLVTIHTDALSGHDIPNLEYNIKLTPELVRWLERLNFKTFRKTIEDLITTSSDLEIKVEHVVVETLDAPIPLENGKIFSGLLGTSSCYFFEFENDVYCIVDRNYVMSVTSDNILDLVDIEGPWFGYDLKSVWHHLKLDYKSIRVQVDPMLVSYVMSSKDSSEFFSVYERELKRTLPSVFNVSLAARFHLDLFDHLSKVASDPHVQKILREIDYPLVPILYRMEKLGCELDTQFLNQYANQLADEKKDLEKSILELAGENFNVASPKQLGVILFEKLNIPHGKKTKTGYSTDNEVLEKIEHPIAQMVLNFREVSKLLSTYVEALPKLISPKDKRLHTHFNQALTTTGRLSSHDPNLQNIPIRTPRGQKVRRAFIAEAGKVLLSVDYSQIELRILAHISCDQGLLTAFKNNIDVHAATASEVFTTSLEAVTPEMRRIAKAVNFGIAYGQGIFGLAETLGISRQQSGEIINNYFKKFPGVKNYIEETTKKAHEMGYVETLTGRRRYIAELQSSNQMIKKFGERAAINAPIQGSASDIVKLAMIKLDKISTLPMTLQVHDEILFEDTIEKIQLQLPTIINIMETVFPLDAPLKVNFKFAPNWDEAH